MLFEKKILEEKLHAFQTFGPVLKYGMAFSALAAIIATESEGVTKNPLPRIMFLSPSPKKSMTMAKLCISKDSALSEFGPSYFCCFFPLFYLYITNLSIKGETVEFSLNMVYSGSRLTCLK